jgi:hypothetical protein
VPPLNSEYVHYTKGFTSHREVLYCASVLYCTSVLATIRGGPPRIP